MMSPQAQPAIDQSISRLSPVPGEEQMSPDQARALAHVREIYHTGTQPLTVARARYDLIRRGVFDR